MVDPVKARRRRKAAAATGEIGALVHEVAGVDAKVTVPDRMHGYFVVPHRGGQLYVFSNPAGRRLADQLERARTRR